MTTLRTFLLLLSITASAVFARGPQDPDSLVREGWYWQDQRVGGFERLSVLAGAADPRVRRAAIRAVAHRTDSAGLAAINSGLGDRDKSVREMAAFAAGQRWTPERSGLVLTAALRERDADVRRAMFDAFGRIASSMDIDSLTALAREWRGPRRGDALTAMMRSAIRGLRLPRAIWYAGESVQDTDPEVRWRALYVLGRSAPHPAIATEVAARVRSFQRLTDDRSPDVRLNLATMLARVDAPEARELLTRLAGSEFRRSGRDWRVLVQTVRSAAMQLRSDASMATILLRGLSDANDHVVIATAMALPSESAWTRSLEVRDSIRALLWSHIPADEPRAPLVMGESMVALVRFSPPDVEDLQAFLSRTPLTHRLRAKAFEALSMAPSASGWTSLSAALQDSVTSVAMAAWDHGRRFLRHPGIGAIVPNVLTRHALSDQIISEARTSLLRRDMGISTVVAGLMSDSSVIALMDSGGHRQEAVRLLTEGLAVMRIPDDVEAMQAVIQALGAFGGVEALKAVEGMLASPDRSIVETAVTVLRTAGRTDVAMPPAIHGPEHTDYDWGAISALGARPSATLVTERGEVVVELLPDDAPFTVLSFVRLARAGTFDGLTFHRVVPNFVVQGGDPRGDGWGGPGYAIRTEVSPRTYERGSVGMASAGRDTEGSQFFFTHLPTPHLDARYTIFARVLRGMDIVDRLQVGDVIRAVRVTPTAQRGARSR